ncbi:hypothetical protein LJC22_06800 [Desulfosarcina sp. OttesenSCG-928-G10]|nr:hypothetical protein [Desulfosarcina sp. OttesenSCG-928-G10]MDL2320752.1 hypothetical protein [Desulfosarcina sp. OttesenSCG-928-B08]
MKSNAGDRGKALLSELEEVATEMMAKKLASYPVLRGLRIDQVAVEVAKALSDHLSFVWGGQQVYIPMDSDRRRSMMYEEFTGDNHAALARRYGVCVQTVYKFIKEERRRRRDEKQIPLF